MKLAPVRRFKKLTITITMILLLLGIYCLSDNIGEAATAPILYVNPGSYSAASVGETVSIEVRIYLASNIVGYRLKLRYNTTLLTFVSASAGTLFPPPPQSTKPAITNDTSTGTVSIQTDAGDIDNTGFIDLGDLVLLAKAYNSRPGAPNWNPGADVNGNGWVELGDLIFLAENYGKINVPQSGLFGLLLGITFNARYGSPYGQAKDTCPLEIINDTLYGPPPRGPPPAQLPEITHSISNGTYQAPYAPPLLNLTLNTFNITSSTTHYHFEDAIIINGTLTGNGYPIIDSLVTLEIRNPGNIKIVVVRTLPTPTGSVSCPLQITGLTPCDSGGSPQYNFYVNNFVYFLATVKNTGSTGMGALVMVNPYDSSNASLGTGQSSIFVPPGSSTVAFLSVPLENTSTTGNAIVYASVLSDYVDNGGVALSLERSATFSITSSPIGTPIYGNPPPQGSYQAILRLHDTLPLGYPSSGTYTIYTTTSYLGSNATQTTQIQIASSP